MHTGRGVGIHWHVLRYMKEAKAIDHATYGALKGKWGKIQTLRISKERTAAESAFKGAMRKAYDDYFKSCKPEVRAKINEMLDKVLPLPVGKGA